MFIESHSKPRGQVYGGNYGQWDGETCRVTRLTSHSTFRHVDQMGDLHQPENIALAHDEVVKFSN